MDFVSAPQKEIKKEMSSTLTKLIHKIKRENFIKYLEVLYFIYYVNYWDRPYLGDIQMLVLF